MLSTRHLPQNKGHIQTESEGLEKDISCKWRPKESRSSNTLIRKNRHWNKGYEKRQRRKLHNNKRINLRRKYNSYKYICTQHRSIAICKANANKYERGINRNRIIMGDFNTPLTPMHRSNKKKISKETKTLNYPMDQLDLIDIYRTFHPKTMNFTFFSSAHGTFSK